ncbi:hypothetical protein FNF27_06815 [Cafeteria roenbergensis]|uniref:BBS7 beta-propeller domain-containing protein n=1 Tax=Cafeteria roenbergensis TaxID=33653 RepID=A0A5A8DWR0_CAFRO|nr:hypothetical protein FNF27_06815 [Cafeteria roenbergensis]
MDVMLSKQELMQVTPSAERHTLAILQGKKGRDRLAVGDSTGAVTVVEVRKGVPTTAFVAGGATDAAGAATPVHRVEAGGAPGKRTRLFVSRGQTIAAYDRKGTEYFALETTLTAPIRAMRVGETVIWAAADTAFTVFDNGAETAFWVSPEAIADLTTETITRKEDTDAVLACADGTLRVCAAGAPAMLLPTSAAVSAAAAAGAAAASATMAGSNSSGSAGPTGALSCVETHATPLAVELLAAGSALSPDVATSVTAPRWKHLVWGSDGGSAGSALADSTVMRRGWALANAGPHRGGGVTALYAGTDVTGDGVADVVIGRDDGALQVFSAEPGGGTSSAPVMTFAHNAGESIRSLGGGNIGSVDHAELVFQSYGGRVVSLTTESTSARDADDRYGRSRATVQKEARVTMLRAELAELEAKTSAALEELTSEAAGSGVDIGDLGLGPGARPGAQGGLAGGDAAVKARGAVDALRRQLGASATVAEAAAGAHAAQLAKAFDVTTTFTLDAQTAAYRLTVEAPVLIDSVILEADVAIDVLDLNATGALSNADQIGGGSADASAAIVSVTPCDYAATLPGSTGRATSEVLPRVLATLTRRQTPAAAAAAAAAA